jgi:hypothetical protein
LYHAILLGLVQKLSDKLRLVRRVGFDDNLRSSDIIRCDLIELASKGNHAIDVGEVLQRPLCETAVIEWFFQKSLKYSMDKLGSVLLRRSRFGSQLL